MDETEKAEWHSRKAGTPAADSAGTTRSSRQPEEYYSAGGSARISRYGPYAGRKVTRELVLAPKKSTIKIGNDEIKVADLQFQIAESRNDQFGNFFFAGIFQLVYRKFGNHAAYERRFRVRRRPERTQRVD